MRIAIINGPNLNLLGKREQSIYGSESFESYLKKLSTKFPNIEIDYFQSNVEGEIVNQLQEVGFSFDGIILNAAAYTHTSIAIVDAVRAIETKVVEVHISNIFAREEYRKTSLLSEFCVGVITGFDLQGYDFGIEYFQNQINSD